MVVVVVPGSGVVVVVVVVVVSSTVQFDELRFHVTPLLEINVHVPEQGLTVTGSVVVVAIGSVVVVVDVTPSGLIAISG